ncbi:SEC-C metal-binding domain-containing protein [Candidatus Neomicrothrix sp.]|uniref:SEC-C metal-binding domain-containing protein n=1 Tax=Candidatus Neomicrothrix sp. TaxID=2719034 RepID=UPI003CD0C8D1
MARRNERCPCGSGRKCKVCHLGRAAPDRRSLTLAVSQDGSICVSRRTTRSIRSLGF